MGLIFCRMSSVVSPMLAKKIINENTSRKDIIMIFTNAIFLKRFYLYFKNLNTLKKSKNPKRTKRPTTWGDVKFLSKS